MNLTELMKAWEALPKSAKTDVSRYRAWQYVCHAEPRTTPPDVTPRRWRGCLLQLMQDAVEQNNGMLRDAVREAMDFFTGADRDA